MTIRLLYVAIDIRHLAPILRGEIREVGCDRGFAGPAFAASHGDLHALLVSSCGDV
jgi:hypothetical protein